MGDESILAGRRVAALIPAAGSGRRLGGAVAKPYVPLGGREILARTLEVFERCTAVHEVWVVVAAEQCDYCQRALVDRYGLRKIQGLVVGGAERQESVWQGLQRIAPSVDLVVVHDGVRPFVTATLICQTLQGAAQHGAAITAVPLTDTLKRVSEAGQVETTLPRERLWRTQTPQAFRRDLLYEAFQYAHRQGLVVTDEAGLIEAFGHPVYVVPGAEYNVKITTPDDLYLGKSLLRSRD
jgi:2-C-methyl-D-erythritol 4-phosphate cytidylyltransferase